MISRNQPRPCQSNNGRLEQFLSEYSFMTHLPTRSISESVIFPADRAIITKNSHTNRKLIKCQALFSPLNRPLSSYTGNEKSKVMRGPMLQPAPCSRTGLYLRRNSPDTHKVIAKVFFAVHYSRRRNYRF